MDRVMVYDGALPQTTDILNTNKFGFVGQAYQNRAILGTNTVVAGLPCTATVPTPDLHVTVGVGSIYQLDPTDASAYADLGVDNNNIVKQGILATPQVLLVTPPATSGFSQVYLVEAILNDVDAGTAVLSYFNSSNPTQPFAGPANSGTSNFTTRTNPCVIALKAGVPAATGTQVTPSPDVGFVGLYAVTVANGQTQITSTNIVQLPSAPFFPTLPSVPSNVLNGSWVYAGQDTGAANAYVITFVAGQPIPSAYVPGMGIKFKALNACTGASTINVNGLGVVTIKRASGVALAANDIISGQIVELTYDGTVFQMVNYLGAAATTNTSTTVNIPYIADSGTQNAIIATYSPAITSGQQVAGLTIEVKLANSITGACTINVNGLGAKAVTLGDATNPPFNVFVAGEILLLIYDGTEYQIAGTSAGMFYRKPTANYTIFVNTATGSDTLFDGTSATVGTGTSGPLKTIGKAVSTAFGYAPSQFSITIQVASGTYNEAVATPTFAGPNLIINGSGVGSVVVSSGTSTCFTVTGPNTLTVQNLTVQNTAPSGGGGGFLAQAGATMTTSSTASNAIGGGIFNTATGTIQVGAHTYNGSCFALYFSTFGGLINLGASVSQTISTPISVASATAVADLNGSIAVNIGSPAIFSNAGFVSGPKYLSEFNGTINTTGQGANYFPGSVAGSTTNGGQIAT
jgi:hypothetical protein